MTKLTPDSPHPFCRSEDGQTLVEYALLLSVISLGLLVALGFLRDGIANAFSDVITALS